MQPLRGTIGSDRLGFGCTAVPGRLTKREAFALLDAAYDNGLRHFDTARMYCSGESEAVLGAYERERGVQLVIVTKAGMTPPSRLKRAMSKVVPGARAAPLAGQFAPDQIRASVETSLRELRRERLDALLLHEIRSEEVTPQLKDTLAALRLEGKVGAYGIATSVDDTDALTTAHPDLCSIVQVSSKWLERRRSRPPGSVLILHSVLGARLPAALERLRADPNAARRFKEEAGLSHADIEGIGCLMLKAAVSQNPDGVTLFSTAKPERIVRNMAAAAANLDTAAILALEQLLGPSGNTTRAAS